MGAEGALARRPASHGGGLQSAAESCKAKSPLSSHIVIVIGVGWCSGSWSESDPMNSCGWICAPCLDDMPYSLLSPGYTCVLLDMPSC